MKRIIVLLVIVGTLFGCSKPVEEEKIWVVPDCGSMSYDSYYSTEKNYTTSETSYLSDESPLRIVGTNPEYQGTYGVDENGIYVQTLEVESYMGDSGWEYEYHDIDKQYIVEGDYSDYHSLNISNGYWFFFQKGTGDNAKLVSMNYLGKEQILLENFNEEDCLSFKFPDDYVLYILKYKGEHEPSNVKLYTIYCNEAHVEEIDAQIEEVYGELPDFKAGFIFQYNNYHILYSAENPDFIEKRNYLESNTSLLNDLLDKYQVAFKEDNEENAQYNKQLIVALIEKEYGINHLATYDYDVINKTLTYKGKEEFFVQFPSEQIFIPNNPK